MGSQAETRVVTEIKDRVLYATIERPEAKNALTKSMYAAIRDAAEAADANPDVDILVLRGSHGAFAVGGDLKEILDVLESDNPTAILDYDDYLPFEAVRSMRKPSIAYIDGLCIGGGLTLASQCDILIASDKSRFAIPEAKVGIIDGHLPRLLRQMVPPAKLRHWMYTGVLFPASEAYQFGLLTQVVPQAEMEAALAKCIADLKASSLAAIRDLKKILIEVRPLSEMTDAYLTLLKPEVLERLKQFSAR